MKSVNNIPHLNVQYEIYTEKKEVVSHSAVSPYRLQSSGKYSLQVNLMYKREVPCKVYAPRFKKPKNYGWNVLVRDSQNNVIVCDFAIVVECVSFVSSRDSREQQ